MTSRRGTLPSGRILTRAGRNQQYLVLLAAVLISIAVMLLGQRAKLAVARTITLPLLQVGRSAYTWAQSLARLEKQNQTLKAENAALSLQAQLYLEDHFQNQRLRRALGFKQRNTYRLLPAEVIAKDVDRMVNSVLVNVGTQDGVREMMPVLTSDGLAGRIFQVFDTTSIVQLLLDRNCRVSALVQNEDRDWGIVVWEEGKGCQLKNLSIRAEVSEGDTIVSAGMGGVFPKGIRIGTIEDIGECRQNLFRTVKVRPSVSFSHLEEVFVVLAEGP